MDELHTIFIRKLKLQQGFRYIFTSLFNVSIEIEVGKDVVKVSVVGMPNQELIERKFLQTKDVSDTIATWMFSAGLPVKYIGLYINKL